MNINLLQKSENSQEQGWGFRGETFCFIKQIVLCLFIKEITLFLVVLTQIAKGSIDMANAAD